MQKDDFLKELGFMGFVTRLKRASDAMLYDGRKLYKELGMDIEPNWYMLFLLMDKHGELSVTDISERLGISHPSIIKIINKMAQKGYLEARQCEDDSRRRLLVLSKKAKSKLREFENVWEAGRATIKRMFGDTDALAFLDLLETRIREKGFKDRTLAGLKKKNAVKVVEFKSKFARAFSILNYEWLEEFFEIEQHDREQLDDPQSYIIDPGGQILLAKIGSDVVGTVALISTSEVEVFEVAKMAVTSKYRGYSIGKKLMEACIKYSKKVGKKKLILESNRKQIPAIRLYRSFGFVEIDLDPNTEYARADIRMELFLDAPKAKKLNSSRKKLRPRKVSKI